MILFTQFYGFSSKIRRGSEVERFAANSFEVFAGAGFALLLGQLAHVDQNKVRGAYNAAVYLKHRARMLQWWADFVDQQTNICQIAA